MSPENKSFTTESAEAHSQVSSVVTIGTSRISFNKIPEKNYSMQTTETTRGQWKSVMGAYPEACESGNISQIGYGEGDPIVCVKYFDVLEFASKVTQAANDGWIYRLPTKAEWLTAAGQPDPGMPFCNRAGSTINVFYAQDVPNKFGLTGMRGSDMELTSTIRSVEWLSETFTVHTMGPSWRMRGSDCTAGEYMWESVRDFIGKDYGATALDLSFRLVKTQIQAEHPPKFPAHFRCVIAGKYYDQTLYEYVGYGSTESEAVAQGKRPCDAIRNSGENAPNWSVPITKCEQLYCTFKSEGFH